jgi:hypothetical protein
MKHLLHRPLAKPSLALALRAAILLFVFAGLLSRVSANDRVTLEQVIAGLPKERNYQVLAIHLATGDLPQRELATPAPSDVATAAGLLGFLRAGGIVAESQGEVVIIKDPALLQLHDNAFDHQAKAIDCRGPTQAIISALTGTYRVAVGTADGPRNESLLIKVDQPVTLQEALAALCHQNRLDVLARLSPEEYIPAKPPPVPEGVIVLDARFSSVDLTLLRTATVKKETKPAAEQSKPIATLGDLVTAILKTKRRQYAFYAEVAEDGSAFEQAIAPPAGGVPGSLDGICQLLDSFSLRYIRQDNSVVLLTPMPLASGQINPMELKRGGVAVTTGPIGLLSLFEINGQLEPAPTKPGDVLLKTPDMKITWAGETSLRELLVAMARDKNCEWVAHVRPRSPPPAPGIKPAEPGLVRLTFSDRP